MILKNLYKTARPYMAFTKRFFTVKVGDRLPSSVVAIVKYEHDE